MTEERAIEIAQSVWQIIEDSAKYSFNSAHALAVSYDSLYNAFQKVCLTKEFYQVTLSTYSGEENKNKRDIEKLSRLKAELPNFNLTLGELKWGNDNSTWIVDDENNTIYQSLLAVKGLNQEVANFMADNKDKKFDSFIDLFLELNQSKSINATHWKNLTKINYFKDFGKRKKILTFLTTYSVFDKTQMRKASMEKHFSDVGLKVSNYVELIKKFSGSETEKQYNKIDRIGLLKEYWTTIKDEDLSPVEIIREEMNLLEDVITKLDVVYGKVLGVSMKNRSIRFLSLRTHVEGWISIPPGEPMPKKGETVLFGEMAKKRVNGRQAIVGSKIRII